MLLILGIIILTLFVLGLSYLIYLDAFSTVVFKEEMKGPFKIVYKEHIGPYEKVGPTMDALYNELINDEIETSRGIGLYYDNPQEVEKSKLRAKVGSIIEEKDYENLEALSEKYEVLDLASQKYLVAEFPFKNKMSFMIGVFKVYPALNKYVKDNNLHMPEIGENAIIEIYDIPNAKTYYLMPIKE